MVLNIGLRVLGIIVIVILMFWLWSWAGEFVSSPNSMQVVVGLGLFFLTLVFGITIIVSIGRGIYNQVPDTWKEPYG